MKKCGRIDIVWKGFDSEPKQQYGKWRQIMLEENVLVPF